MPRRELDFYETPPHYIAALFNEVNIWGVVFEPCSGEGSISSALEKLPSVRRVDTNDIDKKRKADYAFDAREPYPFSQEFDWIITNPPFSDALSVMQTAFEFGAKNYAFLARLSFLEPTEDREYFLESNPPSQVIVLPRYSFRLNDEGKRQTDNVTCAWLVWMEDRQPRRMSFYGRGRAQATAIVRGLSE